MPRNIKHPQPRRIGYIVVVAQDDRYALLTGGNVNNSLCDVKGLRRVGTPAVFESESDAMKAAARFTHRSRGWRFIGVVPAALVLDVTDHVASL
jgi:hypothetical protein